MNLDEPLTEEEIEELAGILISEGTPENCMDVSMLDGFLTCLAIGPEPVEAGRWMPRVWGEVADGLGGFASADQAEKVVPLIVRLMNTNLRLFTEDLAEFSPILYSGESEAGEIPIIDEWCMGFMAGVELCGTAWGPFFEAEEHRHLLAPIFHHGTEEGWKQLEEDADLSTIPHEEWVEMLQPSVYGIREFWDEQRAVAVDNDEPA